MTTEQLEIFYKILETKNSWGKNEIKTMLLEVIAGLRIQELRMELEKLEALILNYYLKKGYKIGVDGWSFKVNISTCYKRKEIQIMFKKDFRSNYETVFRVYSNTVKEMFDKAFEYFNIKGLQNGFKRND